MKLFITYAHESLSEVRPLVDILTAGGHIVWFDHELMPGQDWKRELGAAIESCEAYVYALTKAATVSEWCGWEFATAARLRKAVVPVLLEAGVEVPEPLKAIQYADLSRGATALSAARLMGAFMRLQQVPEAQSPAPAAAPKGSPSRAWENAKHWTDIFIRPKFEPQDAAEEIVDKFAANLWRGLEAVGGRVTLTNERLLFEANGLTIQSKPLAVALGDISGVAAFDSAGFIPNGMAVTCRSGEEHRFLLWDRDRVIRLLERQRARSPK